jgi:2-succinyl-5-enolpyruvyl-6-hydroxy-3-cyclohexene-1-carboxylate synthase
VGGEGAAFVEHVATPHGLDFAHAAALFGLGYVAVDTVEDFRAALSGALAAPRTSIVAVHTDREANVDVHRAVWHEVAASASVA